MTPLLTRTRICLYLTGSGLPRSHAHARTHTRRYKLNIWDVGGQATIRSYWRNYFEQVCVCDACYLTLLPLAGA